MRVQSLIDALSLALSRPILLDDPALVPVAYSRQWDVDKVRSDSILERGASTPVREALLKQGISRARDAVRTTANARLGMIERLCLPVHDGPQLLGYVWLLDPDGLTPGDLERLRAIGQEIRALLKPCPHEQATDDGAVIEALRCSMPGARQRAARDLRERGLLAGERLVLCLFAGREPATDVLGAARRVVRRVSVGHAIAGTVPEGAAAVVSLGDPVLRSTEREQVGALLHVVAGPDVVVGESGAAVLTALDGASHQATVALRVAGRREDLGAWVSWSTLGADRLIAQLPAGAHDDVPIALARLVREEQALAATLEAFLDAGGDVKRTAAALSLHRSGLYYRLRRIEALTGLCLDFGDDRLLAHLALRTAR